MKPLILFLLGLSFIEVSFAQAQPVTIYCSSHYGRPDLDNLKKMLPDSLQARVLPDLPKSYRFRRDEDMIMWMSLRGWKLAGVGEDVGGDGGFTYSQGRYLFSREVVMDDSTRVLFAQRLANSLMEKAPVWRYKRE